MAIDHFSLQSLVSKHDDDLYRGDPPGTGLTTRMTLVETELGKLTRNSNKLLMAAAMTLMGVVADIIKNAYFK